MDRRRAGIALVAGAAMVAVAHPPRFHADLAVRVAPLSASVRRIELGVAGLTVIVTVAADAVRR
jgi:hypothetical protein